MRELHLFSSFPVLSPKRNHYLEFAHILRILPVRVCLLTQCFGKCIFLFFDHFIHSIHSIMHFDVFTPHFPLIPFTHSGSFPTHSPLAFTSFFFFNLLNLLAWVWGLIPSLFMLEFQDWLGLVQVTPSAMSSWVWRPCGVQRTAFRSMPSQPLALNILSILSSMMFPESWLGVRWRCPI